MEIRLNQVDLDGHHFQYHECGDESAPPVVALHALGQSAASWDQLAASLGEKYRVLALDQRGHGGSPRMSTYSFEGMCEDLLLFANALGLNSFSLIGHSMGGTVSYLFSESFQSRIDCLIVEDTPPPFLDKPIEIPSKPSESLPFDWTVVPSILKQLNDPNPEWWNNLTAIQSPTLVIGGGSTSHIPQSKLCEVAELIPNCKLETIEGADHNVHQTNFPAYLSTVQNFLHYNLKK